MRRLLWLILSIYVLLAIACGVLNPPFEAPDEPGHYFTVRQIVENRRLPVASADGLARQEAAQSPLYYVLSALIVAPLDTTQSETELWSNTYVQPGHFDSVYNINAFAHTPDEAWPWHGFALGVHAVRIFSALLGLGTLLCIYASGRLLWPHAPERALLVTALVGFLPQYIFLHSAVTNDTLLILASSAALWQLIRLCRDGATVWRLLAIGVTIGLAALTKTTGALLLILAAIAVLLLAWREGRWSLVGTYGALVIVPVVLLTGWMYWRNWTLYGDVFAVNAFIEHAGGDRHLTVRQALSQLDRVWQSSIAVFGWMNLTAPAWVYGFWNGLAAMGVVGLAVNGARLFWKAVTRGAGRTSADAPGSGYRTWIPIGLLALWPMLVFVSWLQFMMRTPADQGRLLFPAVLPVSLALAYGFSRWGRRWTFPVGSLLALATSVYCVFILLPQTYVRPTIVADADIPSEAVRLNHDMGLGLDLVASKIDTTTVRPGESVEFTLYWRSQGTTTTAALVLIEILGREYAQIGRLPGLYHGRGLYPSSLWPVGEIVQERVHLPVTDGSVAPTQGRLFVHLEGQDEFMEIGSVKVVPHTWPQPSKTTVAQIGEGIALTQATLGATSASKGATVPVNLRWQISHAPGKDLTTFVHLGDPAQPPLAQADGPALGGDYPSRFWGAGEIFDDRYDLQLPADIPSGRFPVRVGLYDPNTGQRLPLLIDGERQPDDALLVGWVEIE